MLFCHYKGIPETGKFIKKRDLVGSQFCRLNRKHGAGICPASGEASGSLQSWQKVKRGAGMSYGEKESQRAISDIVIFTYFSDVLCTKKTSSECFP